MGVCREFLDFFGPWGEDHIQSFLNSCHQNAKTYKHLSDLVKRGEDLAQYYNKAKKRQQNYKSSRDKIKPVSNGLCTCI